MQEGIAELAVNELPLVVFNMARGQQDYFQATRGRGWGDYRTITFAPKDVPEAVEHTQLLFHLADLYRTPVILYGDYVIAHTSVGIAVDRREFGPLPPKDWALDGTMTGTGRARQIWTWARGKPNTPGPGPSRGGRLSWRSTPRSHVSRPATRAIAPKMPRSSWCPSGRRACSWTAWSTSYGRTGCGSARSARSRCGPFPGDVLAEATQGCSHVLVNQLNAGQMVDDVRMYAADRSVIRSIGGVSQDASGMRQGDLLDARCCSGAMLAALADGGPSGAVARAGHGDDHREEHLMTVDTPAAAGRPSHEVATFKPDLLQSPSTSCARGAGTPSLGEWCSRC